ncbi:MAG: hypothetical protein K6E18_07615 [Lachnospiraceae bacterium]|nr:hypothetical protein [Lachnospiraceae bacterium]
MRNKRTNMTGWIKKAQRAIGLATLSGVLLLSPADGILTYAASAGAGAVLDNTGTTTVNAGSAADQSGSTSDTGANTGSTGQTTGNTSSSGDANTQSGTSSKTGSDTEKSTLETIKSEAKLEITGYGDIKKIKADKATKEAIDETVKKYNKLIGTASRNTNIKGLSNESSIDDCVSAAKEAIDGVASKETEAETETPENTTPSSTSDFIMVGGNWVTPTVSYGQSVAVVLPVVNMSQTNLVNVTVTPVISNSVQEWPFELQTSGYTQTIPDLPGKGNGQDDMERRRELTWIFQTRADALSGYYKLQFNVLYANEAEVESCVLTTFVKVIGAPGSGNAESEGGGLSTPRVIVTGYETNPAQVHAGDTFVLTLHLKNTSRRTAVSNMLVNLSAPNDGLDTDSTYAAFLPTSGSNSEYIANIGKGQSTDLVVEMTAKADLAQKPYQLDVAMEYEDEDYNAFTATADVSIPVIQEARFELGTPEIMPEELPVGSEANVMFSIYNLGKVTLYNVKVRFEGDFVSGGDTFLGKIEAGATGNVDTMVTAEKAMEEGDAARVVVTYEDEAGHQQEYTQDLKLKVTGGDAEGLMGGLDADLGAYDDFEDFEDVEANPASRWIKIGIAAAIAIALIVVIVVIVTLVKKSRRKKEEKEDLELLAELEEREQKEKKARRRTKRIEPKEEDGAPGEEDAEEAQEDAYEDAYEEESDAESVEDMTAEDQMQIKEDDDEA